MATSGERRLAAREREVQRDLSGRRAAWAFLWTLFAFKIATVAAIWWAATATHSGDMDFIVATTWYWFLIPLAAIAGPLAFRWRLLQMRRRREKLRGAEWMDINARESHAEGRLTVQDIILERDHKRA
jgi:hypothetical protein